MKEMGRMVRMKLRRMRVKMKLRRRRMVVMMVSEDGEDEGEEDEGEDEVEETRGGGCVEVPYGPSSMVQQDDGPGIQNFWDLRGVFSTTPLQWRRKESFRRDPDMKWENDPVSEGNQALNFTVKETVCPAEEDFSTDRCDFKEDGMVRQCTGYYFLEERPPVAVLTCHTVGGTVKEEEEEKKEKKKDQPKRIKRFVGSFQLVVGVSFRF
ncbi:cathelicidin-related peptide Oh-Cath-like [Crotalus adamanteus]|uniref:Cathelicidin-related antimicrobial peptide n=1 Tax=Crotalus adamanteus TaxID=8729 RepID=A0AAW1B2L3_CROAD